MAKKSKTNGELESRPPSVFISGSEGEVERLRAEIEVLRQQVVWMSKGAELGQVVVSTPKAEEVPKLKKKPAAKGISRSEDKLLDTMLVFREDDSDAVEKAYMARQLVQCTLPHSDPGDVPVWTRTNGKLTLAVRPYVDLKTRQPLYPYGSIPRLLLFWIVTEALQKQSRHIRLGNSLDAFMREIGLNPRTGGGKRGDAARLHSQMERLFRATVTFEERKDSRVSYVDMQVGPKAQLWWDTSRSQQDNLWESWVELGEDFYAAIKAAPVPVDTRALRALRRSPLALDLYAWLAHTVFQASRKGKPRIVPWEGLHGQMGAEYAELRQFRSKALTAIAKIRLVYPSLKVEATTEALTVHPGPTPIQPRNLRIST